ncbi:MAG: hypothetical protein H3C27_10485 [Opitutaceae bacterium]|nr:hypothetical protein [Opitutaceae bacterium]
MSSSASRPNRTRPRAWWLGLLLIVAAAVILWWLRDSAPREVLDRLLTGVRAAGPTAYFTAMALLPAPLAWFTVPAGELFAAQLTLPGVVVAALVAVAVQLALSYAVARYGLRPLVARLIRRRGYTVPRVTPENALSVALLVRLTPGPPMILGSCILAVAEMPFRLYMVVSWLIALPWVIGGVVLGRGMLAGDVKLVALGIGVIGAVVVAVHLWRRKNLPGGRT